MVAVTLAANWAANSRWGGESRVQDKLTPMRGDDSRGRVLRDNRLLEAMPADIRSEIERRSGIVQLNAGDTLLNSGSEVSLALFPFGGVVLSMMIDIADGRTVEVASIGREGAYGGIISCGKAPAFARARVHVGGSALRISLADLNAIKDRHPFLRGLFCRYSDYLLAQVMQLVACNAFHTIEARAARWMLANYDRTDGDTLATTQEALAEILGVQRTTINAVAREFDADGAIETRRGLIRIADRDALQARACECYAMINRHFDRVIAQFAANSEQ
jgi:CRP-like cAMP-binding protein